MTELNVKITGIKEKYEAVPEMEISTGVYIQKIGRKYVHILSTWNGSKISKMGILDFYNEYI